jgi:hypothetical protein
VPALLLPGAHRFQVPALLLPGAHRFQVHLP